MGKAVDLSSLFYFFLALYCFGAKFYLLSILLEFGLDWNLLVFLDILRKP